MHSGCCRGGTLHFFRTAVGRPGSFEEIYGTRYCFSQMCPFKIDFDGQGRFSGGVRKVMVCISLSANDCCGGQYCCGLLIGLLFSQSTVLDSAMCFNELT